MHYLLWGGTDNLWGHVPPGPPFLRPCNRRAQLRAREVSSFCDFWKITCCDFTFFEDVLGKENFGCAHLMSNFYDLDFSECCYQEVINLSWCSLYILHLLLFQQDRSRGLRIKVPIKTYQSRYICSVSNVLSMILTDELTLNKQSPRILQRFDWHQIRWNPF